MVHIFEILSSWSFDMGPVHFLFYTTEFYYYDVDKSWGKQRLLDQAMGS